MGKNGPYGNASIWDQPVDENGYTNGANEYFLENEVLTVHKYWQNEWGDDVKTDYEYYYPGDEQYEEFKNLYDEDKIEEKVQEASLHATKLN